MTGPSNSEPRLLGPELLTAQPRAAMLPLAGMLALALALGAVSFAPTQGSEIDLNEAVPPPAAGHLSPIDPGNDRVVKKAVASLRLLPHEKAQIETAVVAGQLQLGVIRLWDYMDVDGDVVTVSSSGFAQSLPLTHQPTIVVVPYSGPGTIALTGTRDGGGGITVAVSTVADPIRLRPMFPGETIQVTIP